VNTGLATGSHKFPNGHGFESTIFVVITASLFRVFPVNQGINACLLNKQLTDNNTLEWTIGLRSEHVVIQ
jgi:hypothetical protein